MVRKAIEFLKKRLMNKKQYIKYLKSRGVIIGTGCDIDKTAYFEIEPWLIKIGNNVRISRNVQFVTHDGGLWTLRRMGLIGSEDVKYGNITIGDNCNIGWNVIIMPNVHIGKNCVIAAGAIVTKDVPEGTVWGGIPAKEIETIQEYWNKVKGELVPTYSMEESQKRAYLMKARPDLF